MEKRESLIFQENLALDPPRLVRVRCCGSVPYCRNIFYFAEQGIGGDFSVLQMDYIDRMNVRSLQSQGTFWH